MQYLSCAFLSPMAMGTAAHLLTPPPGVPTTVFSSNTRFSISSLSLKHSSSFPHSLRKNCKRSSLTQPCSLFSGLSTLIPVPQIINSPQLSLHDITPLTICKFSAAAALAIAAVRKAAEILLSPLFWLCFSWTWIFWPWILASSLAFYGLYSATRHSIGRSTIIEQVAIVTSTITWLTLVPPAHFNGFLEGWPFVLFFVYHYFFFFESSVRKYFYGDLLLRDHDAKWDIALPKPFQIGFFFLVMVGHWLAAHEGPELHTISNGWASFFCIWALIAIAISTRYQSIRYLARYSEEVFVPMAVVQFGPYRWVRHPIYASSMLLFSIHCISLRAPLSLLFLMAVCSAYYGKKAELEEAAMVESFGEMYVEYRKKVLLR